MANFNLLRRLVFNLLLYMYYLSGHERIEYKNICPPVLGDVKEDMWINEEA